MYRCTLETVEGVRNNALQRRQRATEENFEYLVLMCEELGTEYCRRTVCLDVVRTYLYVTVILGFKHDSLKNVQFSNKLFRR